jgi:hypothetical protein
MLDKRSGKKACTTYGKSKLTEADNGKTGEAEVKSMLTIFLTSRRLFTKNSSWQAKQQIPHTTATFHGNCVNMCEDFAPNIGHKRTGSCITTMHRLILPFLSGNF